MRDTKKFVCLFVCLLLCGCDQPATTYVPPKVNQDHLPLVAHPEFSNWSRFPVGTTVIRQDTLAGKQKKFLHTTLKLVEKSTAGVKLQSQSAIETDGVRVDKDAMFVEYPALFRLPDGMVMEQFLIPAADAIKVGNEKWTLAAKDFQTEVYTFEDQSEAGPVDVRTWVSNEIPGRQAKKEIVDRKGVVLSSSVTVAIIQPTND